jgi:hypothetical protein
MHRFAKLMAATVACTMMSVAVAVPVELDPKVIAFKLPDKIEWRDNPRSGNRSAVLHGDPTKPGLYVVLLQWHPGHMSRPHFHPNDRFFLVVSGTWWVGSGPKFDTEATVAIPAGSTVTHFAKGVHYDGAKTEQATIIVWGEGPATSTPFTAPAQ